MTARDRLERTRLALAFVAGVVALLRAAAAGLGVLALASGADFLLVLPRGVREWMPHAAVLASMAAGAAALWRARGIRAPESVALWIEHRQPALRYALVTAVDPACAGRVPAVEAVVAHADWAGTVARAGRAALWRPALLLAASAGFLALLPAGTVARVTAPHTGDVLDAARGSVPAGVGPVVVTAVPPPYAGRAARTDEDPLTVRALAGSTIRLAGRADAADVTVRWDDDPLSVRVAAGRWTASRRLMTRPVLVTVARDADTRLIAVDPVPDSVPAVLLLQPARDTVVVRATGVLPLEAALHDDLGLAEGWFEYIVSTGSGESFTFRGERLGARTMRGTDAMLSAALDLDALELGPGDVVHLRAVARDGNTVTGPGVGASETRTLRVLRPDERDTSAIVALPPLAADTALLSQRMLIDLTEELVGRVPRLGRETVVRESGAIARDQASLRRRVADVIFMRLGGEEGAEHGHGGDGAGGEDMTPARLLEAAEASVDEGAGEALDFHGDETPVVAINRPLLEAYNAMWDAGRELSVAEPEAALPHMYRALEAIQRARAAERIYLRSRPPRAVVDLEAVRLAGERRGVAPAARTGGPADRRTDLARRLDAVLAGVATPAALADSLLVLRVAALGELDDVASALGEAAAALRAGGDATGALITVRRALGPPVRGSAGLPMWGSVP